MRNQTRMIPFGLKSETFYLTTKLQQIYEGRGKVAVLHSLQVHSQDSIQCTKHSRSHTDLFLAAVKSLSMS